MIMLILQFFGCFHLSALRFELRKVKNDDTSLYLILTSFDLFEFSDMLIITMHYEYAYRVPFSSLDLEDPKLNVV